jgi:hypothetical protein
MSQQDFMQGSPAFGWKGLSHDILKPMVYSKAVMTSVFFLWFLYQICEIFKAQG